MDVTVVKSGSNCAVKLKNVLIVVKDIEKAKKFYHDLFVEMTIELIHPIAMEQGLTFAIREGGRTVGSGRVASIIE